MHPGLDDGPAKTASDSLPVGYLVDSVLLVARLESGLPGRLDTNTYLAIDQESLEERVVQVVPGAAREAETYSRSVETLARVRPSVVPKVMGGGRTHGGHFYLVSERASGIALDRLVRGARLSQSTLIDLVHRVVDGVSELHAAGLHHGDLSPANVLVEGDDRLWLTGIRPHPFAVPESSVAPTHPAARYAPPEWYELGIASQAGDVFSLGLTIAELFLGYPLLPSATVDELISMHGNLVTRKDAILAWDERLPVSLRELVARMIEVDWKVRPASALEVRQEVSSLLPREPRAQGRVRPDLAARRRSLLASTHKKSLARAVRSQRKGRSLEAASHLHEAVRHLETGAGERTPRTLARTLTEVLWSTFLAPSAREATMDRRLREATVLLLYRTAAQLGSRLLVTLALTRLARVTRPHGPVEPLLPPPEDPRILRLDIAEIVERLHRYPFDAKLQLALACLSETPHGPLPGSVSEFRFRLFQEHGLPVSALGTVLRPPQDPAALPAWLERLAGLVQEARGGAASPPKVPRERAATGAFMASRAENATDPPELREIRRLIDEAPIGRRSEIPAPTPSRVSRASVLDLIGIPVIELPGHVLTPPPGPPPSEPPKDPESVPRGGRTRASMLDLVLPDLTSEPSGSEAPAAPSRSPSPRTTGQVAMTGAFQSLLAEGRTQEALDLVHALTRSGALVDEASRRALHGDLCRNLWLPFVSGSKDTACESWCRIRALALETGFGNLVDLTDRLLVALLREEDGREELHRLARSHPTSLAFLESVHGVKEGGEASASRLCQLGWQYLARGEPMPAMRVFIEARSMVGEADPVVDGLAAAETRIRTQFDAAEAFRKLAATTEGAKPEDEIQALEGLLEEFPNFLPALERMSELFAALGGGPRQARIDLEIGRRRLLRGEGGSAAKRFRAVLGIDPRSDEALLHLVAFRLPGFGSAGGVRELRVQVLEREGLFSAAVHHLRMGLRGGASDRPVLKSLVDLGAKAGLDTAPYLLELALLAQAEGQE